MKTVETQWKSMEKIKCMSANENLNIYSVIQDEQLVINREHKVCTEEYNIRIINKTKEEIFTDKTEKEYYKFYKNS